MSSMYRVNPLVDVNASITPAQIMYRLDNIHKQLNDMNDATAKEGVTAANCKPAMANNNVKGETKSSAVKSTKKMAALEAKKKTATKVQGKQAESTSDPMVIMDDSITTLKALSLELDALLESSSSPSSGRPPLIVCPSGIRSVEIGDPFHKKWAVCKDRQSVTNAAQQASGGRLLVTINVPARDGAASFLPPLLHLLRARNGKMHVEVYKHNTVAQSTVLHCNAIEELTDAIDADSAKVIVKVVVGGCDEASITVNNHALLSSHLCQVGTSCAYNLGVLTASLPPSTDQCVIANALMTSLCTSFRSTKLQEVQTGIVRLGVHLAEIGKTGKKCAFVSGGTATVFDVVIAAALLNCSLYEKTKLIPMVSTWLSSSSIVTKA